MRTGVAGFQPERLLQARLSRGLTQIALGTLIGRSSGTISKWENGEQSPESEALELLGQKLSVPSAWFLKRLPEFGDNVCFYRSNISVTKEAQTISLIRLKWLNELSMILQGWIDWPAVNIPHLQKNDHLKISDSDIEEAALNCRLHWGLGLGPISDIILVLENAGTICLREELGFTRMDGASRWFNTDNRPYVFLASDKANGCRSRFDAAHELGHLVLHRNIDNIEFNKRYPELERQANLFAGTFLLPSESFAAEVTRPSLDTFIALKPRWKVSVAAMIMRCKQLDIIDDEYATRLWKNYSARGWRRGEPLDDKIEFEEVRLLPRAIKLLLADGGLNRDGLLSALGLGASDCEHLCSMPEGFFAPQATVSNLAEVRLKRKTDSVTQLGSSGNVLAFPSQK